MEAEMLQLDEATLESFEEELDNLEKRNEILCAVAQDDGDDSSIPNDKLALLKTFFIGVCRQISEDMTLERNARNTIKKRSEKETMTEVSIDIPQLKELFHFLVVLW